MIDGLIDVLAVKRRAPDELSRREKTKKNKKDRNFPVYKQHTQVGPVIVLQIVFRHTQVGRVIVLQMCFQTYPGGSCYCTTNVF